MFSNKGGVYFFIKHHKNDFKVYKENLQRILKMYKENLQRTYKLDKNSILQTAIKLITKHNKLHSEILYNERCHADISA